MNALTPPYPLLEPHPVRNSFDKPGSHAEDASWTRDPVQSRSRRLHISMQACQRGVQQPKHWQYSNYEYADVSEYKIYPEYTF